MRGRKEERIEAAVDCGAAVVLAAAVGFSVVKLFAGPQPIIFAVVAAALAYLLGVRLLRRVTVERPHMEIPVFTIQALEIDEPEELLLTEQVELVLTDADRLHSTQPIADELMLDDILTELQSDARVVRLFDPGAIPTPAELNVRIERHVRGEAAPDAAPADASDALYQALNELRRSLR